MKMLWIFLLPATFVTNAQSVNYAQGAGYVINGSVTGLNEKAKVYLTDVNNPTDTISTAQVANAKFALKGKLNEPGIYTIGIAGTGKKSTIFLDNTKLTVSGSAAGAEKLTVTGSKLQQDFEEFQNIFNPLFIKLNSLNEQARALGKPSDAITDQSSKVIAEIKTQVDKFTRAKKNSHVTALLLVATSQLYDDVQLLDSRFASLSPEVQKGYYGRYLASTLETLKVGAIGTLAANFTQNDTTGKPVSLSSFKGKYVLIDFWASWCGPCRQENPNVVNTYQRYKAKNFTVLGVSLDRSRDSWINAIKADGLTWTHVSDLKYWNNEVAQKYKIQSIPQNYLLDPDGKIIARNLRGEELRQRLGELIK